MSEQAPSTYNTAIVNVGETNQPHGYWPMADYRALHITYLVSTDNDKITGVYKVTKRIKVRMLEEYYEDGTLETTEWRTNPLWAFHLHLVPKHIDVMLRGLLIDRIGGVRRPTYHLMPIVTLGS